MNNNPEHQIHRLSPLLGLLLENDRLAEVRMETALKETQLTAPKMAALYELVHAEGPLPLSQLAEQLHCVRSNATQLVDRLEADGLARRVHDPVDRRSVLAQITEEGRSRFLEGAEAIKIVERELLEHFTPQERELFRSFLARLQEIWHNPQTH